LARCSSSAERSSHQPIAIATMAVVSIASRIVNRISISNSIRRITRDRTTDCQYRLIPWG
jgi:hypothetical protein